MSYFRTTCKKCGQVEQAALVDDLAEYIYTCSECGKEGQPAGTGQFKKRDGHVMVREYCKECWLKVCPDGQPLEEVEK